MQDTSIFIAGAAGEGIQTVGDVVSHVLLSEGRSVFAFREYESRIRGGDSSVRIRISDPPRNAPRDDADILVPMNPHAARAYRPALADDALVLGEGAEEAGGISISFKQLAEEHGGAELYANAAAAGALCAVLGLPFDALQRTVSKQFSKYGDEAVDSNLAAARAGYDAGTENGDPDVALPPVEQPSDHAFLTGHEAIALAAAAAGCRFLCAYPMSPSTSIITALSRDRELGVFTEQAEDEIAAINMSLGASAAGARAMVATSGGGFALMVEALSLCGMLELPLVIVIAQRPGPATGLPTRTAQEDLLFALHAGHGEFARLILAPSDPQDAIEKTVRAFHLAERYQVPAIVLTDQYLDDAAFSLSQLAIPDDAADRSLADPHRIEDYARYAITDSGISPQLYIGQSEHLVCLDSDEHDEHGHITEDLSGLRVRMVDKRLRKESALRTEVQAPVAADTDDADTILIGWGSTKGAIDEAADALRDRGRSVGTLHFTELWPLPDFTLPNADLWIVEGSARGPFAHLLSAELAAAPAGVVRRYDGLPITAANILEEVG